MVYDSSTAGLEHRPTFHSCGYLELEAFLGKAGKQLFLKDSAVLNSNLLFTKLNLDV